MLRKSLIFAIAVLWTLFLLLWGWGWADRREYFASPARAGLFFLVILVAGIVVASGLDPDPMRRGRLPVGFQSAVLFGLTVVSMGLIWFLPFADHRQILTLRMNHAWRYLGLLLCASAAAIRIVALADLGKQFSAYVTLQEGHQLVQTGIYRYIRHPLYLSLLLAAPGFALVFDSALMWPILIATAIFVIDRIREEERLMQSEFGRSFEDYRNRTKIIFPLIL